MKKTLFFILVVLAFTSCNSSRRAAQSQYVTDNTAPKVFSVPAGGSTTNTATVPETPVSTRREQISFTRQEDLAGNEFNSFFVIVGSFSQLENANRFRTTLLDEGFTPIILHSETGNYRVCINSYRGEQEARSRIAQVRQAYPKYSDVWLLIKE
ncbi:MAG: SPOR domain-containing protein [Bacteroidales bacterium]|jgi:cell division protein FtsN|nr:SPOR domain-containing protein [Bacteroidales bacterium]